jgi:hypothetical protein
MTDYTMLTIQIGFVLCFSVVFPLAPLIALLTNVFMIRIDAYKLCALRRRPIAQKASGIGVWENVLQVMGVVGVICTCGIIALTSDQLSQQLTENTEVIILIMFAVEHAVLLFKYWLTCSVPSLPSSVQRALADRDRKSSPSSRSPPSLPPAMPESPEPGSKTRPTKQLSSNSLLEHYDSDSDQENHPAAANVASTEHQESTHNENDTFLDLLYKDPTTQSAYENRNLPLRSVRELYGDAEAVVEQPESKHNEAAVSSSVSRTAIKTGARRRSPTKR